MVIPAGVTIGTIVEYKLEGQVFAAVVCKVDRVEGDVDLMVFRPGQGVLYVPEVAAGSGPGEYYLRGGNAEIDMDGATVQTAGYKIGGGGAVDVVQMIAIAGPDPLSVEVGVLDGGSVGVEVI